MTYSAVDFDSFDGYATADLQNMWPSSSLGSAGSVTIVSGGRNGTNRLRILDAGTDGYVLRSFPEGDSFTEGVVGIALLPTDSGGQSGRLFSLRESGTEHLNFRMENSDTPRDAALYRGTTLLATFDKLLVLGEWIHIQLAFSIHDSAGYWYLYVNGTLVDSATSVDTRNGGTAGLIDSLALGPIGQTVSGGWNVYFDDYYIASVASGPENPGDLRVATLLPSGAGNYTDWTPSAGSNYQNVDETASDGDTTYNAADTVDDTDSFAMGDLPSAAASVLGVKQITEARKDDAGSRTLRQLVRIGSTDYEGSDFVLGDSYSTRQRLMAVSPDTSSEWTQSEVDAIESGYKVEV